MRQRAVLIGASLALLLGLGAVLLLRPDRRSAWDQASLSRDLPKENIPGQRGLWADQLRPLLREADALGTEPSDPAERLAWRQANGPAPRLRAVSGQGLSAGLGMADRPERSVHLEVAGLLKRGQQIGVVEIEGFGPESLEPGAKPIGIQVGGGGGQVGGLV